jgi:hypothetical protein
MSTTHRTLALAAAVLALTLAGCGIFGDAKGELPDRNAGDIPQPDDGRTAGDTARQDAAPPADGATPQEQVADEAIPQEEVAEEGTPQEEVTEDLSTAPGQCSKGQGAGLFCVRILDNQNNPTLTDCNTNPGADIDAVVLVRPDGTEFYAAAVELDVDFTGDICPANDASDLNTVLGVPDGCLKALGCGCGDYGYAGNPDCKCSGGDEDYTGYYSLNGGAVIIWFEENEELLCGDQIVVYEMWNPDIAGAEEGYRVAYGDENGNWVDQVDFATGVGVVDVVWEW